MGIFNKIKLNEGEILNDLSFQNGIGFYIVTYDPAMNMLAEIVYRGSYGGWMNIETVNGANQSLLDLFEDEIEEVIVEDGKMNVSEDFLLRLIGISKTSGSNIKVSDILK